MKNRSITILILIAVVLTACSSAAQAQQPTKELQTGLQSTPEPGARNAATTSSSDPVIVFHRSGGFAGVDEEWKIYADGRVASSKDQKAAAEQTVKAEQVSTLLNDIDAAGFFKLEAAQNQFSQCDDCFEYEITVTYKEQTKTIKATADDKLPAELKQVVEKINELIASLNTTQ
jgi:hypothetical protein